MNRGIVLGTMALAMVVMCLFVNADCRAATGDEQAVKESAPRFYEAVNTLFTGNAGPMKNAWSHADDVTYMGPGGGFQVGWKKIAAEWDSQAAKKLGGKVESRDKHFAVTPALAVVYCYEMGENVVNGKPQPVQLPASTVFRKENGTWKVIAHQTDTLPYLKR